MKYLLKFLTLIALMAVMVPSMGQDLSLTQGSKFKTYSGVDGDTLNATYELSKTIYISRDEPYFYDIVVEADSSGDGSSIAYKLQGGYDNSNWEDLAAGTWSLTSTDTTIIVNSVPETGNDFFSYTTITGWGSKGYFYFPYIKLYFLGSSSGADMELEAIKIRLLNPAY